MARPRRDNRDDPDAADLKKRILDCALSQFARKGLDGARVEEIAKLAGAAKRMIYYYFGSKEELYRSTILHAFGQGPGMGMAEDLAHLTPKEALHEEIGRTFDMHVNRPDFVRLLLQENFLEGEQIRQIPQIAAQTRGAVDLWAALLKRGLDEGVVKPGIDPMRLHHAVSALSQFYVSNRKSLEFNFGLTYSMAKDIERLRSQVIELVLAWILL
jgi:AcrR family transcriptional regulator